MITSALFHPFRHGSLELPNRIVMSPMTRRSSPAGIPNEAVADYYRRRAEGGVGLIITEGTTIDRPAASDDINVPNFHTTASLAGWARVLAGVHAAGAKMAPQLWHQGLSRPDGKGPYPDAPSEGPSVVEGRGHAMSEADIAKAIDAYASAAAAAQRLGFDAVELHGAHGYLIDQFLWGQINRRSDRYGGNAVERTRFAVEVVQAVRRAVGPAFPVILRFSQWKTQDYAARLAETPEELERILTPLADAGVDIFHASTRRFWQPEFAGSHLTLAGWSRKLTGRPSIAVGSVGLAGPDFMETLTGRSSGADVGNLDELFERMAADEFDLVAVGRALIGNPDWPSKVRAARLGELKPFEKSQLRTLA